MDKDMQLWQKAADFHGHICGGLTIGYKAALYAMELLDIDFSKDEEIVCVTENDACGVDAIQVILGCTVGKGNLIFRLQGKQAFTFFNRQSGKSVRLIFKGSDMDTELSKDERQKRMMDTSPQALFEIKKPNFELPQSARIFNAVVCDKCKEKTADYFIRLCGEQKLCSGCFEIYDRFNSIL